MKYVRIKSYHKGRFVADHAYFGNNQIDAINRFKREYPEHRECVLTVTVIDDEDEKQLDWFRTARRCGCVHCF